MQGHPVGSHALRTLAGGWGPGAPGRYLEVLGVGQGRESTQVDGGAADKGQGGPDRAAEGGGTLEGRAKRWGHTRPRLSHLEGLGDLLSRGRGQGWGALSIRRGPDYFPRWGV